MVIINGGIKGTYATSHTIAKFRQLPFQKGFIPQSHCILYSFFGISAIYAGLSDVKMAIERVKTGIEGLDKALNGGIPKKNIVLVSGDDAIFVALLA